MGKGIVILLLLVVIGVLGYYFIFIDGFHYLQRTNEPTIDIRNEIAILNEDRLEYRKYEINEVDWKVYKQKADAAGLTFVKMDSWDDFKESLKQESLFVQILNLDENNRVIWYGFALVVYFHY